MVDTHTHTHTRLTYDASAIVERLFDDGPASQRFTPRYLVGLEIEHRLWRKHTDSAANGQIWRACILIEQNVGEYFPAAHVTTDRLNKPIVETRVDVCLERLWGYFR